MRTHNFDIYNSPQHMSSFIRALYRIFIKNRFIRWVWLLALSLWGIKWITDNAIAKKKTYFSKTILALPPKDVLTFTIRKPNDDETTFTRHDDHWLAVHNDITIKIPEDSVAAFLNLFNKMDSYAIKKLSDSDETASPSSSKFLYKILINHNNVNDSLTIFYTAKDSLSGENLAFLRVYNEPFLNGVKTDILTLLEKNFNDYRSQHLLKFSRADISKVVLKNLNDTATFYAKDTVNWTYFNDRFTVISDTFNRYLKSLEILRGGAFYDASRDFKERNSIENQLIIYTKEDSIILTAYRRERLLILHSTDNNENYFKADSIHHIFKNHNDFIRLKSKPKAVMNEGI